MGIFRNMSEKLGFKTYTIPIDSFIKQIQAVNGKAVAIDKIECYDANNNIMYLDSSGEVETKITTKEGKSTVLFFDTLYIENGELYGSNSKFMAGASFTKKNIPVNEIAHIELQANKKLLQGTKGNKKAPLKTIVVIVLVIVVGNWIPKYFSSKPSFDKVMMQAANEINKSCPYMADKETRLDNAVALPDNEFQYNYTLVHIDKSNPNIDGIKKYLEQHIINDVKTNPGLKLFRDNKVTMAYYYKDMNGVFLFQILATPDKYL